MWGAEGQTSHICWCKACCFCPVLFLVPRIPIMMDWICLLVGRWRSWGQLQSPITCLSWSPETMSPGKNTNAFIFLSNCFCNFFHSFWSILSVAEWQRISNNSLTNEGNSFLPSVFNQFQREYDALPCFDIKSGQIQLSQVSEQIQRSCQ